MKQQMRTAFSHACVCISISLWLRAICQSLVIHTVSFTPKSLRQWHRARSYLLRINFFFLSFVSSCDFSDSFSRFFISFPPLGVCVAVLYSFRVSIWFRTVAPIRTHTHVHAGKQASKQACMQRRSSSSGNSCKQSHTLPYFLGNARVLLSLFLIRMC